MPDGWHFEKVRPGSLDPANLHLAQKLLRSPSAGNPEPTKPEYLKWTNTDGRTIEARFHGLGAEAVNLEMRDGRRFAYPLSKLDAPSRAQAERLAE